MTYFAAKLRDTLQDFTDMELSSSVEYVPTIL